MQQLNKAPQFNQPLTSGGVTNKDWYFFWTGLFRGLAPAFEVPITPGASPYIYSPDVKGFVILTGGTVSLVEFSRDGTNFYDYGTTQGQFLLNGADQLRVTYTGAPDMVFVPT